MTDGDNVHGPLLVIDRVDDPVGAHPKTPEVLGAREFPAAGRARGGRKTFDAAQHALTDPLRELLELPSGRAREEDLVVIHGSAAFGEGAFS